MSHIGDPLLAAQHIPCQSAAPIPNQSMKKWWQSATVEQKPEAELLFKADPKILSLLVVLRELVPMAVIIIAMALGATWTTFHFNNNAVVFGQVVNVDVQLAIIGLVNKVLDTFVRASLTHTASICLTVWMTFGSPPFQGVNLLDFELQNELTQPWTCVMNFHRKRKILGWKGIGKWGILRFISCLAISVCVLLLAPAINTVGIPKERWYPNVNQGDWSITSHDRELLTITTPRMALYGLDWGTNWGNAWNLVGSGASSWDAAFAISAASTYTLLCGLPVAYTSQPAGWQAVPNEIGSAITGINTIINGSTVQTLSVQNSKLQDIYDGLQANGTKSFYKNSAGWNGFINLTLPMLTTCCVPGLAMDSSTPIGTMPIIAPPSSSSTLIILIGAIPSLNFTGATCNMTLNQVLFPIGTWDVDNTGTSSSINHYAGNMNTVPIPLASTLYDHTSASALASQLGNTVGHMNGLLETGLVYHMVLASRRLLYLNSSFATPDSTIDETDTAGIAPVIAVIAQHLITTAAWNMSVSSVPNEFTTSYPVRWQVYGAGPRLAWEWIASIVLVVLLFALIGGCILSGICRVETGAWLGVGGMLVAANTAKKMDSMKGSVAGIPSKRAKEARFFVRDVGGGTKGVVDITDSAVGNRVKKDEKYRDEYCEFEDYRKWNWEGLAAWGRSVLGFGWLKGRGRARARARGYDRTTRRGSVNLSDVTSGP